MSTFRERLEAAFVEYSGERRWETEAMRAAHRAGARAALETFAEQLEQAAGKYVGEPHADENIAREACGYAHTARTLAREIGGERG